MTVQTQTQGTRDLRLQARQGLLPARGSGWLAGFGNLLAKELGEWFRTRRWLWQILIWVTILDGIVAFMLFVLPVLSAAFPGVPTQEQVFSGLPPAVGALVQFFGIVIMTGTMGAVILAQDEVIQEKQMGTAAWILSKPVSRTGFILTKLLASFIGVLVFIVALPEAVLLGEVYLATRQVIPLLPFLAGTGVILLVLVFYVSLVIMLGVLCESRGPVLGIALGIMWGGMIMRNFIPYLLYVLPFSMEGIALGVVQGMPLPPMMVSQVISTAVLSVGFILVALWRFRRLEL